MILALGILVLLVSIGWVWGRFQRDVHAGMAAFLGLAVFMPELLGISLPGSLPQLSLSRILLVIALYTLARQGYFSGRQERIPFLRLLILFGLAQAVSLCAGMDFVAGLKECIDYIIEAVLFFSLVTVFIQRDGSVPRLIDALLYGLAGVAAVSVLEKHLGTGAIPYSMTPDMEKYMIYDICSTYPHRILFGYAMAMGTPLALARAASATEPGQRRKYNVLCLLLIVGAYYSDSRGPWLGLLLALAGMLLLGSGAVRKKIILCVVIATAVVLLRPGVRDTIHDLYTETFQTDSLKGASYNVRWQLWHVAWSEVKKSPTRFLIGYGPVSTEEMDLTSYWAGQEGSTSAMDKIGHTSWDNNYAADLIELGVVGEALQILIFLGIAWRLFRNWRRTDPETRVTRAAVMSACFVFMFAMTNVFIFSPQLKYLFWTLAAIGCDPRWSLQPATVEEAVAETEVVEPQEASAPAA